jgi:hypothetical protein
MAVEIPLTRGCVALVDDEDAERVLAHSWSVTHSHSGKTRYAGSRFGGRFVKMHHFIVGKAPKGLQVDHIDGNGFNNTRANLRFVTQGQNLQNRGKFRGCSSAFKGVNVRKSGRISARICPPGRPLMNIGDFPTEIAAAMAYDAQARLLFGQHARVNFPLPGEQCAHHIPPIDPHRAA